MQIVTLHLFCLGKCVIRCFAMAGLTEEDIIRVCIWICSLFFLKNQYNMQNTHIIKYKSEMYE